MNYKSPIRLLKSLEMALNTRPYQIAELGYFNQICLNPFETYFQITNSNVDIVFNGNFKVYIADICGNKLLEITDNVYIEEQTDANGIRQIAFEIIQIGQDFYNENVIFKFVNTLNADVWYSNPILITENSATTFLQYRNIDTKLQSIRVSSFFNRNVNEINGSEYINEIGLKVSSAPTLTEYEEYIFPMCDNFTYRFMNDILTKPIIYINGNRVTNTALLKEIEVSGLSNIGDSEFKVCVNYSETINNNLQIAESLRLVNIYPTDVYTILSFENKIQLTFNHDVDLATGTITIVGNSTYTQADILITGNIATLNIDPLISFNGIYNVQISNGLFTSIFGNLPYTEFSFEITDGEFDRTEFNNTEFLTN